MAFHGVWNLCVCTFKGVEPEEVHVHTRMYKFAFKAMLFYGIGYRVSETSMKYLHD